MIASIGDFDFNFLCLLQFEPDIVADCLKSFDGLNQLCQKSQQLHGLELKTMNVSKGIKHVKRSKTVKSA